MEEANKKLEMARRVIERTDMSLFLTGRAGTGKTTFLRKLRQESRKRMVVTAPTGIAAINAGGVTLHSFFQLDFGPFIPGVTRENRGRFDKFSSEKLKIIRGMDVLVIDEISMVRADLLDAVDDVLRRHRDRTRPFGGVQLLLIGDLQQLPPVVVESERDLLRRHYKSPYFFDSHALAGLDYATIELDHVYRQDEGEFLDLLNAIRDNRAGQDVLRRLNTRFKPGFSPADEEGYIRLTTHNHLADKINSQRMDALPTQAFTYEAHVEGNFPQSSYPVSASLTLKKGAQVMFTKNDAGAEKLFYNGMIGHVTDLGENFVKVFPVNGSEEIDVPKVTWENVKYVVDEKENEIKEQREGAFSQLPLKPAWAITIHKSQGLTFDRAIIDASGSFAHGQTYVALSRCRTMEGLVLERPLAEHAIISDHLVREFLTDTSRDISEENLDAMEKNYAVHLSIELFDFRLIQGAMEGVERIIKENFMHTHPALLSEASETVRKTRAEITEVGVRFAHQLLELGKASQGEISPQIKQRIHEGAKYFLNKLKELEETTVNWPATHDNKRVAKKLAERSQMLHDAIVLKTKLMGTFAEKDFSSAEYIEAKADALLTSERYTSKSRKSARAQIPSQQTADNLHPALYDTLTAWRRKKAEERGVPAYQVMTTKALLAVSNHLPTIAEHLLMMPGIGNYTAGEYGEDLLKMVEEYISSHNDLTIIPMPMHSRNRHNEKKTPEAERPDGLSATEGMSMDLFREGKSVDEICLIRGLKPNTIFKHIFQNMRPDEVELLRKNVEPRKATRIQKYLDTHTGLLPEIKEIIAELGEDLTYNDVRIMRMLNSRTYFTKPESKPEESSKD